MNLSTQLRIILLLVGAAIWLAIYLLGRHRTRTANAASYADLYAEAELIENTASFEEVTPLDEAELDTPAYLRRQGMRESRQDYEPRIAHADDYVDDIEVRDEQYLDELSITAADAAPSFDRYDQATASLHAIASDERASDEPVYAEPAYALPVAAPTHTEPMHSASYARDVDTRREPVVELQASVSAEPPTLPNIPVVAEPAPAQNFVRAERNPVTGPALAPTLSVAVPQAPGANGRNQNSMRDRAVDKPAAARRKIIALRLPMAQRVSGATLLDLLRIEHLEHGKFNIFHRMHEAGTVFSVASMVEPGSFDIGTMANQEFPGVSLFMLLPGPLDGLVAYDQMMSCAQRLAHATGGVLHDERGSTLTTQGLERLREEVLDFQHLLGGA